VWSLEALLARLDAVALVPRDGLWCLPDDPVPPERWRTVWQAWQAGTDWR
jgi:hypothetical protein